MTQDTTPPQEPHAVDAAEAVVHLIPIVLPTVGAAMMLLLAFIAVFMA